MGIQRYTACNEKVCLVCAESWSGRHVKTDCWLWRIGREAASPATVRVGRIELSRARLAHAGAAEEHLCAPGRHCILKVSSLAHATRHGKVCILTPLIVTAAVQVRHQGTYRPTKSREFFTVAGNNNNHQQQSSARPALPAALSSASIACSALARTEVGAVIHVRMARRTQDRP